MQRYVLAVLPACDALLKQSGFGATPLALLAWGLAKAGSAGGAGSGGGESSGGEGGEAAGARPPAAQRPSGAGAGAGAASARIGQSLAAVVQCSLDLMPSFNAMELSNLIWAMARAQCLPDEAWMQARTV